MYGGPIVLALAGVLVPVAAPGPATPGVWRLSETGVLGTEANFAVTADQEDDAYAAIGAARAEIDRLDAVFNSRRADSDLGRFVRGARPTHDLQAVLARAAHWREASGGAFDPRITGDLCLDAIAKGYIVDCAIKAGLRASKAHGLLVDIGGEMRCQGLGPDAGGWRVGIADPRLPYLNAPPAAYVTLRAQAIATSGRGVRDRRPDGSHVSITLDPGTSRPVTRNLSATVIAPTAMDADALATALYVLPAKEGLALAEQHGVQARITDAGGGVHRTLDWKSDPPPLIRVADSPLAPGKWLPDWAVELLYVAPNRQENRSPDFRSPYMALWITDKAGKPIRTIMLVGQDTKYQKENYVWWSMYKTEAPKLVELRSGATSLSGRYSLFWPGYDDAWKFVPQGEYVLHVETSQEHGKHTHRTMPLVLGPKAFKTDMPATPDGGGLAITYGHRD